ncbi:MAG: hypothetical protein MI723_16890 [Caulobacterales bacterium]|nr:hypothetical protein [Caulobacterales bacterium]
MTAKRTRGQGKAAARPETDTVARHCRVEPGEPARLAARETRDRTLFPTKSLAQKSLADDAEAIDGLQDRLFAERTRALLVVLQGMDTAGKGGVIRSVFGATGPMGVRVAAFGKPSAEELAHDYLWRVHDHAPPKGFIGVFDRSHYEDVLIVKVRALAPADAVEQRYDQINAFEKHLAENGVTVVKLALHLSREVQAERLRDRLAEPRKRWKFNPADLDERALWPDYAAAYETALERCSTPWAPWHVVPADSRSRRNAIAGRIVRGALEAMEPRYPTPDWDEASYTVT